GHARRVGDREIPLSLQRARELGGQLATFVRGEDLFIGDRSLRVLVGGGGVLGGGRHGGSSWSCDGRVEPMPSAVIVEPPRSERYLDPLGPLGLQWASTRLGVDPLRAFQPARASQARRGVRTAVVTKNSSPVKDEVVTSARPVMLTLGEGRHGCALCGY